jgi:enoyl-CoA hydratase/carnithine racemase
MTAGVPKNKPTMYATGQVQVAVDGSLATVTLRQDGKFNAMSRAMWNALRDAFVALSMQEAIRCIVVRGHDGHFCAGGDISEYQAFRFDPVSLADFHEREVWGALQAMLNCDIALVAAIDGNCMGAGLEIASCCDIRIATSGARFGAPIARLGFPMAPRELDLVMSAVGPVAARQFLLEADVLDAQRMHTLGFLTRVLDDTAFEAGLDQTCQRICALAPQAARMNKRSIRALRAAPADDARGGASRTGVRAQTVLDRLADTAYDYADSPEHREGIAAFIAKRRPQF